MTKRNEMTDKLPAPCEHCGATGIFHGSECIECRGKVVLDRRGGRLGAGPPQGRVYVVIRMEIIDQICFRSGTRPL